MIFKILKYIVLIFIIYRLIEVFYTGYIFAQVPGDISSITLTNILYMLGTMSLISVPYIFIPAGLMYLVIYILEKYQTKIINFIKSN